MEKERCVKSFEDYISDDLTEPTNEYLDFLKPNPIKISKKVADEIIDNPQVIGGYHYHLNRIMLSEDIIRVLLERPLLVTFFQDILYKLNNDQKTLLLNTRPELKYNFDHMKKSKYVKQFEDYTCTYFSDALRTDMVDEVLKKIKNGDIDELEFHTEEPNYDDLLDPWNGYEYQTFIQYIPDENKMIYFEGWSKECWKSLYAKPEYKGIKKEKAIEKVVKERLTPALESLGLKFDELEYWWQESNVDDVDNGYIMKVSYIIN
jgi:hypothetical protein